MVKSSFYFNLVPALSPFQFIFFFFKKKLNQFQILFFHCIFYLSINSIVEFHLNPFESRIDFDAGDVQLLSVTLVIGTTKSKKKKQTTKTNKNEQFPLFD